MQTVAESQVEHPSIWLTHKEQEVLEARNDSWKQATQFVSLLHIEQLAMASAHERHVVLDLML